ncbi:hypothetical protein B296_00022645 [Ensete ventricosum]|uniref:Uncharacterized protein n=1 Tax=Ensete ventricosum TaxID=4639 RepID=A0A427AM30_ENSVE|nr:hypothetical protein B296_00022645 [Ensete ventricosum]
MDLQAGRVSKAKGAVKVAAGIEGRKRAAVVRRGLRQRENMAGRQRQQRCCARQRCGRGGSDEGLATTGCALPRASQRQCFTNDNEIITSQSEDDEADDIATIGQGGNDGVID